MCAFKDFPVIKTLSAIFGDVTAAAAGVDVPLAYIGGIVAGIFADFGNSHCFASKRSIVKEQAVSQRILPRKQAGAIRRTDRTGGNRVGQVNAFGGELVQVWSLTLQILIAAIAGSLGPPLIGEYKQYVWSSIRPLLSTL